MTQEYIQYVRKSENLIMGLNRFDLFDLFNKHEYSLIISIFSKYFDGNINVSVIIMMERLIFY